MRLHRKTVVFVLSVFLVAGVAAAVDTDLGAVKGETYLEIVDGSESRWYKTTTTPGSTTAQSDPSDRAWNFNETINITFLTDPGDDADDDNPPQPDTFTITAYYSNKTGGGYRIRELHSGGIPSNGTEYLINATENLSSSAADRSGVVRIRLNASFSSGVLTNYEVNSDTGTTAGGLVYDTRHSQGYLRSAVNITNFTTYRDESFTVEETNFTRGETVYIQFGTGGSVWNDTGVETLFLDLYNTTGHTVFSDMFTATHRNNTYRTQWEMPVDAALDNYTVTLEIRNNSNPGLNTEWTFFHNTGTGYKSDTATEFSTHTLADPDNEVEDGDAVNTSFWVEEELRILHDPFYPRANHTKRGEWNMYVNRGEALNVSFTVEDEWSQGFANRVVNLDVNASEDTFNASNFTTDSMGKASGNVTVGVDWPDTYHGTGANSTEPRNYTTHIHFPATVEKPGNGGYAANRSVNHSFDVDTTYYGTVKRLDKPSPDAYNRSDDVDAYAELLRVRGTGIPHTAFNFSLLRDGVMEHNFTRATNRSGENKTVVTIPETAAGSDNYTLGAVLKRLGNTFFEEDLDNFTVEGPGPDWHANKTDPSSPVLYDAAHTHTFNITWESDSDKNITTVTFTLDTDSFTWTRDGGDSQEVAATNYNGTRGVFMKTVRGLAPGKHSFQWEADTAEGGNTTPSWTYQVVALNVTVSTMFTDPTGSVYINNEERSQDTYTDDDLGQDFNYIIQTGDAVYGAVDYSTGASRFHSLSYAASNGKTVFNMTQTGNENAFLLPYTTGGRQSIEDRESLVERGVFGERSFLQQRRPSFGYALPEEGVVSLALAYNASTTNISGFNTLNPGRHSIQVEKTGASNDTNKVSITP